MRLWRMIVCWLGFGLPRDALRDKLLQARLWNTNAKYRRFP